MPEILLIDDDAVQLQTREAVLRDAGFTVCSAGNAARALAMLRTPRLNHILRLIITDHVMPGASGVSFVRKLRRFSPDVPVIVMTGSVEAKDEYAGLNVIFLSKPCPPEELIQRARAAVSSRS